VSENADEIIGFGERKFARDYACVSTTDISGYRRARNEQRTNRVYSIEYTDKIYLDVHAESSFETVGHFPSFWIIAFEHLVGKWNLFMIVGR
jgi:hypothetical protein